MFLICFQYFFRILNYHAGGVGVADGVGGAEGPGGEVVIFSGVGVVSAQGLLQIDIVGVDRLECVCGVGSPEGGTRSLGRTRARPHRCVTFSYICFLSGHLIYITNTYSVYIEKKHLCKKKQDQTQT